MSTSAGDAERPRHDEDEALLHKLGYAQVLRFLAGDCTEDEARAQTVLATRRFARRQDAWFRRDPRVVWLVAGTEDTGALRENALHVIQVGIKSLSQCSSMKTDHTRAEAIKTCS